MFKVIKKENNARRGEFVTPHGTVQTPAFMNVATCGAIKGAVSALDLKNIKCQVQLCNTITCICAPEIQKSNKWAVCINSQDGTVLYLPTAADFRCFHLQN